MKTVDIKGKPYVEVNERIKYFRTNYQDWAMESELISNENGVCVIKAIIRNPEGIVKATGYAYEKENSTFINKTSYIENCETSAWGRALGNLGIGIDTSIASAEEVLNAQLNQETTPPAKDKKTKKQASDKDMEFIKEIVNFENIDDLREFYKATKDQVDDKRTYYDLVIARSKELKND